MKKVYLIIPVYNVEQYLKRCLDSVFSQTYKNLDVICVNDGSTDGSLEMLNEYKKVNKNMVLINKMNGGLSSARNAGLNYISIFDSYVMFLDSDDWLDVTYIEKMVNLLEEKNADIVCSKYFSLHDGEDIEIDTKIPEINTFDSYDALVALFSYKIQSHGPCKLYKNTLWHGVRYDESISFLEDQSTVFKTFIKSNLIVQTSYQGYYYYHRFGSICQSYMSNKKILSALRSYNYVCDYKFPYGEKENRQLFISSFGLFINAFLMLYPRFNFKNASNEESQEMANYIKKVVCNKKIIKKCKFKFKTILKLKLFFTSKKFYLSIYKKHLKNYDQQ